MSILIRQELLVVEECFSCIIKILLGLCDLDTKVADTPVTLIVALCLGPFVAPTVAALILPFLAVPLLVLVLHPAIEGQLCTDGNVKEWFNGRWDDGQDRRVDVPPFLKKCLLPLHLLASPQARFMLSIASKLAYVAALAAVPTRIDKDDEEGVSVAWLPLSFDKPLETSSAKMVAVGAAGVVGLIILL